MLSHKPPASHEPPWWAAVFATVGLCVGAGQPAETLSSGAFSLAGTPSAGRPHAFT
jgi:hypothetical protein